MNRDYLMPIATRVLRKYSRCFESTTTNMKDEFFLRFDWQIIPIETSAFKFQIHHGHFVFVFEQTVSD